MKTGGKNKSLCYPFLMLLQPLVMFIWTSSMFQNEMSCVVRLHIYKNRVELAIKIIYRAPDTFASPLGRALCKNEIFSTKALISEPIVAGEHFHITPHSQMFSRLGNGVSHAEGKGNLQVFRDAENLLHLFFHSVPCEYT